MFAKDAKPPEDPAAVGVPLPKTEVFEGVPKVDPPPMPRPPDWPNVAPGACEPPVAQGEGRLPRAAELPKATF